MASIVCRNTFLDVVDEGYEGKDKSRACHPGGQRARSAESLRRESHEESSNGIVELQLVRLNQLLELDPAGRPPLVDGATTTAEPTSLSELVQLQKKLQEALVPMAPSMSLNKMPSVQSNTSISTMCPTDLDDAEFEGESGEGYVSTLTPTPSVHAKDMSPQLNGEVAAQSRNSKVPRSLDLAAEYQRSNNSASPPTTIMIRNIPNRYTQRELMMELEELGFAESFDFVYIPVDKCTRANLGYAFVNFVEPCWAEKCMGEFQNYRFKRHRDVSSKIAAVSIAHLQGLENNLAHYANSVVNSSRHKQRRPVVLAKVSSVLA